MQTHSLLCIIIVWSIQKFFCVWNHQSNQQHCSEIENCRIFNIKSKKNWFLYKEILICLHQSVTIIKMHWYVLMSCSESMLCTKYPTYTACYVNIDWVTCYDIFKCDNSYYGATKISSKMWKQQTNQPTSKQNIWKQVYRQIFPISYLC